MQKGFTLIEITIAIFILAIAIVGIFSAFFVITIMTADSVDRLTATYLAQEGMEIVRNIRDQNWLNMDKCLFDPTDLICPQNPLPSLTWLENYLNSCPSTSSGCQADYTNERLYPYNDVYLYADNGFYGYTSLGTATKFKRKIIIDGTEGSSPNFTAIKVKVEVSWDAKGSIINSGGGTAGDCGKYNCILMEEVLYNWYNYEYQ
jgi:prepilin-type N-terminal cleavage/methylation domain-containing protein